MGESASSTKIAMEPAPAVTSPVKAKKYIPAGIATSAKVFLRTPVVVTDKPDPPPAEPFEFRTNPPVSVNSPTSIVTVLDDTADVISIASPVHVVATGMQNNFNRILLLAETFPLFGVAADGKKNVCPQKPPDPVVVGDPLPLDEAHAGNPPTTVSTSPPAPIGRRAGAGELSS